jgi:hypothetical protein
MSNVIFSFLFYKIGEHNGRTSPAQGKRGMVGTSGKGEVAGKVGRRVVQKCAHKYPNAKMIRVATIPGMEGRRIKENG